jgi:hypothetical protein
MSSSGCESSRDFLPQQPRRTRRRERRRKRATGGRLPPRAGSPRPLTESRGGGRGASVWGGRGSACRQAVHGRGGTRREGAGVRRGGVWECDGGDVGRGHSARRALEEEEAGLLHLEVGNRSSRRTVLERQEFNLFVFAFAGWRRPPPPSRLPRRSGRTRLSPRGGAHRGRSGCQEVRWRQRARPRESWSQLQIRNWWRRPRPAVMTTTVTAPSILPAPAPTGGNQVAVVEIPDDDVPPPGWDQWVRLPAPAPGPLVGVLVMREDGCVMSGCPADDAEASSSRAALPASDDTGVRPEQEQALQRATGPLRQCPGRAGTVAGIPRPWCLAQPGAERGATDPWRSRMARLLGL